MIEFYLPQTTGETLAWCAAIVIVVVGLFYLLCPRLASLWIVGKDMDPKFYNFIRGNMGGIPLGLGLSYLVFAQPFIALTIGCAYVLAALGRVVSFIIDRSFSTFGCVALFAEILLALTSLSYALGYIM